MYGLLDPAHTPLVHRSPMWRRNGILKEKRKAFEPSPFGFTKKPHAPVNSDIYKVNSAGKPGGSSVGVLQRGWLPLAIQNHWLRLPPKD